MTFKMNFSNHCLTVRLNLSLDNVRNCEETTTLVKEYEKIIKCKKKEILNLRINKDVYFKYQKSLLNLKKCTTRIE